MKLNELLNYWLEQNVRNYLAEKTYDCYADGIRRFSILFPSITQKPINEIKEIDFQECIDKMAEVYARSTTHHLRIILNEAFRFAEKYEYIKSTPIKKLQIPKYAKVKEVEALTISEQKAVEKSCEEDILGYVLIFLLRTGLRLGELINLKWQDYNEKRNSVIIAKSKTSAGKREIPLSKEATLILYICKSERKNDFIFCNTKGNPLTYSSVRKLVNRIRKSSEVKQLTPHICRHSFATRLVERGVDYKALSKLLGHTDVAFTLQRYVTADFDFLKEQLQLINN